MNTYIAILRGINVSGHKKIQMSELKAIFEELHFRDVLTYIQSGNVIFQTEVSLTVEDMVKRIEDAIEAKFGFSVPVIVRSKDEMEKTLPSNPFLQQPGTEIDKLHVTFLETNPQSTLLTTISNLDSSPDKFSIIDREVYLYCPGGYGNTKLSNTFFEQKLKVRATTRNWKTVSKLVELASGK
jgi:uncharacterized protein (DUF1697 family)